MKLEQELERLGICFGEIELVRESSGFLVAALNQVGLGEEEARKIERYNSEHLDNFLQGKTEERLGVYFKILGKAIGAIKFCPEVITTREKREDGLYSVPLQPYVEIASISTLPEFQGQGLSKKFYNLFLDIFERTNAERLSPYLLVGARGLLADFYGQLYSGGIYSKSSDFIPKEIFGKNWDKVGEARPDSLGTVHCCTNLGMKVVGSSRSLGGPIFRSRLSELKGKRLG